MIAPQIVGRQHVLPSSKGGRPFFVGQLDPARGYVHVLDDVSLLVLLTTLDTAPDFVRYLRRKEAFVASGLAYATGEEDLLAFYLKNIGPDGGHDFVAPEGVEVVINEGHWHDFSRRPERRAQLDADRISYLWDAIIGRFNDDLLAGTLASAKPGFADKEATIRFLAREPRTRRRILARSLVEILKKTPRDCGTARVLTPTHPGDPYYVFVVYPLPTDWTYEEYRKQRRLRLEAYCLVTKLTFPEAFDVIGLATESGMAAAGRSEDLLHYDARSWTEEMQEDARIIQKELGILKDVQMFLSHDDEYPLPGSVQGEARPYPRNRPCWCGSGRKFKRCHGEANNTRE